MQHQSSASSAPPLDWSHIDPAFGHWLAGFVDGEGSFLISPPKPGFTCEFVVSLRADDYLILQECIEALGVGSLRGPYRRVRGDNPIVTWMVTGKTPCYSLVTFFDLFPLRAKKAQDYAIWREAVIEWNRIGRGKGHVGADWSRMAELSRAIREVRQYRDMGEPAPVMLVPEFHQAELTPLTNAKRTHTRPLPRTSC